MLPHPTGTGTLMTFNQDKTTKILVVDDDPNMINLIKFYLVKDNVEITPSNDGFRAIEILQTQTFDLILIDMLMPKMDGRTLLHKISQELNLKIPVIVVTAHGPTDNLMELIDEGAYDILQKPFTTNRLKLTLHNALRHKNLSEAFDKLSLSKPEDNRP
jgi:DNA-binding NtrC family response regulator